MAVQSTPRRSVAKGAAVARRLNAASTIAQHVLDATVEIEGESRSIIYKQGKYGELFLVRSVKFLTRYYPVTHRDGKWTCDASNGQVYIGQAQRFLAQAA